MAADATPEQQPLSPTQLTPFSVDEYASEALAQGKGLGDLQAELSKRLAGVQQSLFSLINRRYEDFLQLSTSLTGVDDTIGQVRRPLGKVAEDVGQVHGELSAKLEFIDSRLAYRQAVREKRQLLRVFIDLWQLLDRADMVLKESAGGEDVKCLERAAVDLAQIRYFGRKAADHPFVKRVRERIDSMEQTLLGGLARLLSQYLGRFGEGGPVAVGDLAVVTQCLRAYSTIEEGERAEAIIRNVLVGPMAQEVFRHSSKGMGMEPSVFSNMLQRALVFVERVGVPLVRGVGAQLANNEYQLMARVFWRSIATQVMEQLPLVFVPGMPDRFHENYRAACRFMQDFGRLFAGEVVDAGLLLAAEPSLAEFNRKWQLSAYFSIRKRQIVNVLDDVTGGSPEATEARLGVPVTELQQECGLLTEPAARLVWTVRRCWASSVYLEPLAAWSWQLHIQLLMWYVSTMVSGVQELIRRNGRLEKAAALESADVRGLLWLVHDSRAVRGRLMPEEIQRITKLVVSPIGLHETGGVGEDLVSNLEQGMYGVLDPLTNMEHAALSYISATIVSVSCANLTSQLRRTTSQYRHTNRSPPTTASPYITKLFSQLVSVEEEGEGLGEQAGVEFAGIKQSLRQSVCSYISLKFSQASLDALATLSKAEASLQRLRRATAGRHTAAGADGLPVPEGVDMRGTTPATDNEKIRRQIWLDAKALDDTVHGYGVDTHKDFAEFIRVIAPLGT
ncbi:hypothetical protein GGF46_004870 [Coemansia sp. RSA 552]|nr:hypothetical protein GGF46_004870 [Coemansia sp. RSA 552]